MNKMPDNSIIVMDIVGNSIKIRATGKNMIDKAKMLGFSQSDGLMMLSVINEQVKVGMIQTLINIGAFFLYGYGWYPAEVMDYYKARGMKFVGYKIIYWTDKNTYHIEDR